MASVNKVIILGNLGADPESRFAPSGDAVCNIRVATSETWKDKATSERKEATEWHRVSFYGKLAEIAGQYLRKGSQVYIEGSLRTEKYTDKQGVERYSTDVIANEMQMLGGMPGGAERGERGERGGGERPQRGSGGSYGGYDRDSGPSRGGGAPMSSGGNNEPFPDDDIPF